MAEGPGARLRALVGFRGKAPGGGPVGESPEAPVFFNTETAFSMVTYIHKIAKFET